MDKSLRIFTYSFQDTYYEANKDQFFKDLFHTDVVLKNLECQLWNNSKDKKTWIEIEDIPCTILSTEFFDRIYKNEIVLHDGTIRKCFEEYMDDIVIADELRNILLVEESYNYPLYTDKERAEFLFLIFQHFCLGGSLNQYEDNINPYILMAKTLYKDLLCVRKTGSPKKTTIMSQVFKVEIFNDGMSIYPSQKHHKQNFSYVILNSILKEVTILQHTW
ncbi:Cilia- and flagella-associated protein 300 like protein [Argiope bruennichi]|uniref:Cilia- and flagella-associated protein 300 n=2 Tax=Argiope bruennichi TaxID=94029 RepID=A0A8T0DXB2_ARGBR|nr:Cilia- and flagella-associated protein 300 like protein [Argiope bruennichi]